MTRVRRDRTIRPGATVAHGRLLRFAAHRPALFGALAAALAAATTLAAQDSAAARRAGEPLPPRTVSGRVVRPGASGMVNVARTWVTLHRVAPDSSGPVDSARTDANGRYSIRYRPYGEDAVYFASSMYGGVAYFTPPLPATDAGGAAGEITVFDTTSALLPIRTRGRHLVVSSSAVDGRRTMVEVFELSNDTTVTAISGARGHATWSTALAPNAADFQVGQSDIGPNAVQFRDGRVLVYASISPGIRQVAFSYSVPATDFPLAVPVADSVAVFEVLLEDPGASASGGGLAEQPPASLEGRTFRRYLGQDVPRGAAITIDVGAPTGVRSNRLLLWPVVAGAAAMALALVFALTRRPAVRVIARPEALPDAARLARDIADLDDAFARVDAPSATERDAYERKREALKAQLNAALAKEGVAV